MLPSPATESPAMVPTASGRNRPSSTPSAASATNRPLSVIEERKSGPRPGEGCDSFTTMAMMTGTTARTPRPARLRRRPKISRSSEARNRSAHPRTGRPSGCAGARPDREAGRPGDGAAGATSAADIEALPRERDEQVLQAGSLHGETHHRHAVVDQGRDDLLGRERA